MRCRVCRRTAFAVLSAVITIEVMAFALVTHRYESDRIADVEQRGRSSVVSMFATHPYPMDARLLIATVELLLNHSTLAGGVVYREDGSRVGAFGEEPALTYGGPADAPPVRVKNPEGNRIDVLWTAEQLNASYVVAARLDIAGIGQQYRVLLLRIAAIILLVSFVVAGAVAAILFRSVFRPLVALQASMEGVTRAADIAIDEEAFTDDEIGDVALSFDGLRKGVADSVTQIHSYQVELEQAKASLEQHIQRRNAEIADADQALAKEIEERRRVQEREQEHLRLARIPEENPNPVIRVSTDATVLYANPAARPLLTSWAIQPGEALPEGLRSVVQRFEQGTTEPNIEVRCEGKIFELVFQPIADAGYINIYGRDVSQERIAEEDVRQRINLDPLTGLPNRTLLQDRLRQLMSQIRRDKRRAAVHLIDLDHFADFVVSMGAEAGDAFIEGVADRLRKSVRESDTVARIGGDEFAVLQRDAADHEAVAAFAQKLLAALSRPYRIGDQAVRSGASIGITVIPEDTADLDQVLRNAEMALFHAKGDGRGTYRFFAARLNEDVQRRRTTEADLQTAFARGDFILLYQPILCLRTNRVAGAEALIRWRQREGGLLAPAAFLPAAEKSRLILPIGRWAIEEACRQNKAWQDNGLGPLRMAVNLSPVQLRDKDIVQTIRSALEQTRLKSQYLELDVGGAITTEDPDAVQRLLKGVAEIGVSLTLDDFGSGASRLGDLRKLPFKRLKIDKPYVDEIGLGGNPAAVVRAATVLGHSLGMEVAAEGVEGMDQLSFLQSIGCEALQGFVFSKPLAAPEFQAFYDSVQEGASPVRMAVRRARVQ